MDRERQLVVCCDGTSNTITGGKANTNVVKLTMFVGHGDPGQTVFYDPGVGNAGNLPGVTGWDWFARHRDRILGLALGRGVYENVAEAYLFLMRHYQYVPVEAERGSIFIFGFSRGAFTARSVAGMVRMFGILPPHLETLIPTLIAIYFAKRKTPRQKEEKDKAVQEIKEKFSRPAVVHFVGIWDTVDSVGLPPFTLRIPASPTIAGKEIHHVRHALALDEHRAPFMPRLYSDPNGPVDGTHTMNQRWFRGAHCDVGGGYTVDKCLTSHEALAWLLDEARAQGLRLHDGPLALNDIAGIRNAIVASVHGTPRPPIVHSEVRENSLWAIAGLTVRNPCGVDWQPEDPPGRRAAFKAEEHSSVAPPEREFPDDTSWKESRGLRGWIRWGIGVAVAWGLASWMAFLLYPGPLPTHCQVYDWMEGLSGADQVRICFAQWQLTWWRELKHIGGILDYGNVTGALIVDFAFILAYGYVLAWPMAWAFERRAGLRRASMPPPRALNVLGRSLKYAVIADLVENLCTLLVMCFVHHQWVWASLGAGTVMSLAALVKFLGLAGAAMLILWACVSKAPPA